MDVDAPSRAAGRHYRRARRRVSPLVLSLAAAIMVVLVAVTVAVARPEPTTAAGIPALSGIGPIGVMAGTGAGGEDEGIEGILGRVSGYRVGVAVADTAGGAVRTFGDDAAYAAASTAKIITAAAYFQRVEAGEARFDEMLGSYTGGNDPGPDEAVFRRAAQRRQHSATAGVHDGYEQRGTHSRGLRTGHHRVSQVRPAGRIPP